jgi:hypothetical protein
MDASFNGMHRLRVLVGIAESDGFLTLATVFFETDQPIESQFIRQDFALSSVMGGGEDRVFSRPVFSGRVQSVQGRHRAVVRAATIGTVHQCRRA